MRKFITILGILLTVTILLSGSAVAAWVWVTMYDEYQTSNILEIEGAPDDDYATLGQDGAPPVLGWVILDLGASNAMPPNQDFMVVATTIVEEDYDVFVGETYDVQYMNAVGSGTDSQNETFTTPGYPTTALWRYILIQGQSGVVIGGDYEYGPDIDAVGWNKP